MVEWIKGALHSLSEPRKGFHRAQDAAREKEKRRKRGEEMLRSREEYAPVSANSMRLKQQPLSNGSTNNKDVETNHPVGNPGAAANRKQRKHKQSNSSSMTTQPPLLPPVDTRLRENSQVKGQSQYKSRLDPGSSIPPQKSSRRTEPAISASSSPQGNHDTGTFYKNDDRDQTQQFQDDDQHILESVETTREMVKPPNVPPKDTKPPKKHEIASPAYTTSGMQTFLANTTPSTEDISPLLEDQKTSLDGNVFPFNRTGPTLHETISSTKGSSLISEEDMPSIGEPTPSFEETRRSVKEIRRKIYEHIFNFRAENKTLLGRSLSDDYMMEDLEKVIEDLICTLENNKIFIANIQKEKDDEMEFQNEIKQRMYRRILHFSIENSAILKRNLDKQWSLGGIEGVIDDLIKALEDNKTFIKNLQNEKENERLKLENRHDLILDNTKKTLREEHSLNIQKEQGVWAEEKTKLEKDVSELRQSAKQIEQEQERRDLAEKNRHHKELQEQERRYEALKQHLEEELTKAATKNKDLMTAHGNRVLEIEDQYSAQVSEAQREGIENATKIKRDYKKLLKDKENEAQEEYIRLKNLCQTEKEAHESSLLKAQEDINALHRQHAYEKVEFNAKHTVALKDLNKTHEVETLKWQEEKKLLESQLASIHQRHTEETKRIKDTHNMTLTAMKHEHDKKLHQVFMGDGFKSMSDADLATGFRDLVDDIEHYARVSWAESHASTWPFPPEAFANPSNQQEDQQFLFQNTIWTILYEQVFRNPFQVLGDEGVRLQEQWLSRFGGQAKRSIDQGPPATRNSEEWRFDTLRQCASAINQLLEPTHPYYKAKLGYDTTIQDAKNDILRELGNFAPVTDNMKNEFEDVVKQAAAFWLEVGQQRYRLFLLFSHSGAEPVRSGRHLEMRGNNIQKLVLIPELRRRGNAQGDKLDGDEMVTKCTGDFREFSF